MGATESQIDDPIDAAPSAAELASSFCAVSQALQNFLIAQARASGLGLLEFLLLARSADSEGVVTREAARALGLNTSTMTGLTDRLEKEKLIRRYPHPTDRRLRVLRATPKGQRTVERAFGSVAVRLGEVTSTVQPGVRQVIAGVLADITGLLLDQAQAAEPRLSRRSTARVAASR